MKNSLLNQHGFTLIEIIGTMIIIGILLGVGVSQYVDFSTEARIAVTQKRLNAVKVAISGDPSLKAGGNYTNPGFENHMGFLPASLTDLVTVNVGWAAALQTYNPFSKRGWRGPYLNNSVPGWNQDSWGNAFVYNAGGRTVTSNGPNGAAGGGDDIVVNF